MKAYELKEGDVFRTIPPDVEGWDRRCIEQDRNVVRWGWAPPGNAHYWGYMGGGCAVELVRRAGEEQE